MSRCVWTFVLCLCTTTALAQQQGRGFDRQGQGNGPGQSGQFGPGGPGGPGMGGPGGRMGNPMFNVIDADGDGVITTRELRKAVAALKTLDADHDGNITMAEASGPGGPGGDPAEMIDRLFQQHDTNKDGKLTEDELPPFMARMLNEADTNKDGALDREELTKHMEEMQSRGPGGFGGRGRMGMGRNMDPDQMAQQMLQNDTNKDGRLTADEVPQQMMPMLQGADLNNDHAIDASELKAAMERMSERMNERMNNRRGQFVPGGQFGPGGQQGGGQGGGQGRGQGIR